MADLPQLLTIDEVAEHLRLSGRTVYRMVELKKLRAVKVEGSYRVFLSDLVQYIALNATIPDQALATNAGEV